MKGKTISLQVETEEEEDERIEAEEERLAAEDDAERQRSLLALR